MVGRRVSRAPVPQKTDSEPTPVGSLAGEQDTVDDDIWCAKYQV